MDVFEPIVTPFSTGFTRYTALLRITGDVEIFLEDQGPLRGGTYFTRVARGVWDSAKGMVNPRSSDGPLPSFAADASYALRDAIRKRVEEVEKWVKSTTYDLESTRSHLPALQALQPKASW